MSNHGSTRHSDATLRALKFTAKERKVLSNYTAPPPNRHHSPGVVSQLVNKIEKKSSPPLASSKRKKIPPLAEIDDLEMAVEDVVEVVKSPRRKKYTGNPLGNLKILNHLLPGTSKDPKDEVPIKKLPENKENTATQTPTPSTGKRLKKSKSKGRVEPEDERFFRLKRTMTDNTNNHSKSSPTGSGGWRQIVSSALGGPLKKRLSEGALLPSTSSGSMYPGGEKKSKRGRLQRMKSAEGSASSSFFGALIRLSSSAVSLTSLTSLGSLGSNKSKPHSPSNTKEFVESLRRSPPPPTLVSESDSVQLPTQPPPPLRKSKTCQNTPDRPPIIPSITITESRSLNRIDRCRPITVDGSGLTPRSSRRSAMSRTMSLIPTSPSLPPLYEEETASTAAMVDEERIAEKKHRMRRYGGSNTTSTYQGRKDVAPDASPRRHLIGFLHRTSHLSLTSELSGNASFYLIGHRRHLEESTIGSESDARVFSDDDDRGSTTTDFTSVSRQHEKMAKKKKRNIKNFRKPSRASSFSSITESSMSLDVITVNLNMDTVNFLGISIVGQTSTGGDNGIYVANIMKGGAVALDGRIEAGDMLLQVNDVSFENFTNDQAVDVLRGSTTTDFTSVSRQHEKMAKKKKRNIKNFRKPSRASSFSSITESSMSLDVITVNLNMDTVNFLGISIVGQTSTGGDNGIYVANIMKGGAVALDGRIEAGDMLLQVNDVSFENFTNDQAVDVLREAVSRRGPIKLTVAKSFENGAQSCFTIPRNSREEPVRPIDTQAWIQHTNAMRGMPSIVEESAPTPIPGEWPHGRPPSSSTVTSNGSNGQNTVVGGGAHIHLDVHTDKKKVVEIMAMPGSGLDIKNRTWLKIPIPMSFLGSDLVEWLLDHIDGLRERKTARNYAAELLKLKYIAHVVNKVTFTEQCYYVLGEECADYARFRNEDGGPKYQWTIGMNNGVAASNGGSVMLPPPHLSGPGAHFKGMAPSMVSDGESRMYVMHI
uniref:PDZ domain-containing protein n=3 Tax=Caenorhabditis japonica TaxID=281687 RepID=A0A8R1DX17_CAEJA